ncbi:MAG: hypothetical protein M3P37_05525 [Actinomycetota bacterium]|nr:hypothetical protein [Actinomycetota bacterium]
MISHRCPHGDLYSCPVCEFGELCGFLELELGGSGSVERTNVFYFECGPRRPRSLADCAEGLFSDAERSSATLGYLGPPEEDLCPEAARDFVLSEAIKEAVLPRLLRALSALPVPERPVSLTLFAWGSKEDSPDSRPASSWRGSSKLKLRLPILPTSPTTCPGSSPHPAQLLRPSSLSRLIL